MYIDRTNESRLSLDSKRMNTALLCESSDSGAMTVSDSDSKPSRTGNLLETIL